MLLYNPTSAFDDLQPKAISIEHTLAIEQWMMLIKLFSNDDVKNAAFHINVNKGLRPYGFKRGFSKDAWNIFNSASLISWLNSFIFPNY